MIAVCPSVATATASSSSAVVVTVSADRRRIALIGALHRHAHDRPSIQVDGVLSLVGQMRTPVLHFRDPRIRVVWMPPVGIAALLRALAIKAR